MDFIFCREYGFQPVIPGVNFGRSEQNGNPLVIANVNVKPDGITTDTRTKEVLIQVKQILYSKLIELKNFNEFDINTKIYVGKKTGLSFKNVAFDFVNDKWRFRNMGWHFLNETTFNVYDRPKIKSILSYFLTRNVDQVHNLMYTTIAKSDGLSKFLAILEVVIEYGDDFFKLLEPPVDVPFVDKYDPKKKLEGGNGSGSGNGSGGGNGGNGEDGKKDNTVYWIGGTLLALFLWKRRNKKNRKS